MGVVTAGSSAVNRAAAVLGTVGATGPVALSAVAAMSGLARSSTSDLAAALVDEQLLHRDAAAEHRIGAGAVSLGAALVTGVPHLDDLDRLSARLAGLVGYTLSVDTLYAGQMLCTAVRLGSSVLANTPRAGLREPVLDSAAGRAVLTALDDETVDDHLTVFAGFPGLDAAGAARIRAWRGEASTSDSGPLALVIPGSTSAVTLHGRADSGARADLARLIRMLAGR